MLLIPCFSIGVYGVVGIVSGDNLVAGLFGTVWGYLAVTGVYELLRRRFSWSRGSGHSDWHLLAGTIAVSSGLVVSGALHETMPILALVPALSATRQANDGHAKKHRKWIHVTVLAAGFGVGTWLYMDGVIGQVMMQKIDTLP